MIVEPSLFVYNGVDGVYDEASFAAFYRNIQLLADYCAINDASIPLTPELRGSVNALFPFQTVTRGTGQVEASIPFGATALVLKILERHVRLPEHEFGDSQPWSATPGLQRPGPYGDDSLWLSWTDLIYSMAELACGLSVHIRAICSGPTTSCLPSPMVELTREQHRVEMSGSTLSDVDADFDGGLNPVVYGEIRKRLRASPPPATWEDSGHQPSIGIKTVLVRAARESGVVVRLGTTWRNPTLVESCKLSRTADSAAEEEFRVSDGHECVKGTFRTIALNESEGIVCRELLRRAFVRQCQNAGFAVSEH